MKSLFSLLPLVAFFLSGFCRADEAPSISDVKVYQALTQHAGPLPAAPEVHIAFTLAKAADVTVEVASQRPDDKNGWIWGSAYHYYMADPLHVQTLKPGHLEAGAHEVIWNGLDDKGGPVTGTNLLPRGKLQGINPSKHPTDEQMEVHPPVNLFHITVEAGTEQFGLNYRRVAEVPLYREIPSVDLVYLAQDGRGGFVAANRSAAYGSFLSSGLQASGYFPKLIAMYGDPVGCGEQNYAEVDGHGHVLMANGHAIFRYNLSDGKNANFSPSKDSSGNVLGNTPHWQYQARGWAIDKDGNICALRQIFDMGKDWESGKNPLGDIEIFDNNGISKRVLSLPKEAAIGSPVQFPSELAVDKNGDFWVGGYFCYLVDGKTGALKGQFKHSVENVVVGSDGSVYGWNGSDSFGDQAGGSHAIFRLHADGTPYPFGAAAPGIKNKGEALSLNGDDSPLPPALREGVPTAIVGCEKGDFYVAMPPGDSSQAILHFSADGKFLPESLPRVDLIESSPDNIFVEDQPVRFDFAANNPTPQDRKLVLDWTLTDFYGQKTSGKSEIEAKAMSRQACVVTIPVPDFGFYTLTGSLEGEPINFKTALARIRHHDLKPAPDSHFGMCGGGDFHSAMLAGLKKDRFSSDMWQMREPVQGLVIPDIPDEPQAGFTARRNDAADAGVLEAEMSNYSEPWTEAYPVNQIHDLTLYLTDWMGIVDRVAGKSLAHYQFWNEPCDFWNQPTPFSYEIYDTVNGDFWDINKARDKETRSIGDGDPGVTNLMPDMGANGTAIYNDALECHYAVPNVGQQPKFNASLGVNEMGKQGFPDFGSLIISQLVATRDKFFPGKPILDTEEGWYTDNSISDKAGADVIPRMYISDIAAGVDEIYWFLWYTENNVPTGPSAPIDEEHPSEAKPQASYCSFATMTQMLEGAEYVGTVDLQKEATRAYLFRKGDMAILPVWAIVGQADVTLPLGVNQVTIFDLMSRKSQVSASAGSIPLHLSDSTQYVTFPFNDWAKSIAKQELDRQMADLKLTDVTALPQEMETSASTALIDLSEMNRFSHLVKAARQAAFAGLWPNAATDNRAVQSLRAAILAREETDGYLRQSRLPLNWSEQIVRVAAIQGGELQKALLSVANETAQAAQPLLKAETLIYPGFAANAFIGDVGEIEKIRAVPYTGPNYPFYEAKFRTQIPKKAGESFELELTAWNFYRHPIQGTIAPKLPDGWTAVAAKPQENLSLEPGKFARMLYTVTIPSDAKPGIYPIDGKLTYHGQDQPGIHPQRVQIQ